MNCIVRWPCDSQVHVAVKEQGPSGDDADQGVGSSERRWNGRPLLPGQQPTQRALHLPRSVSSQPAVSRPSPAHRRQLRSLRGTASDLRRTRNSLGLWRALRRTERSSDVACFCHPVFSNIFRTLAAAARAVHQSSLTAWDGSCAKSLAITKTVWITITKLYRKRVTK